VCPGYGGHPDSRNEEVDIVAEVEHRCRDVERFVVGWRRMVVRDLEWSGLYRIGQ
jgi:hypothetical protein